MERNSICTQQHIIATARQVDSQLNLEKRRKNKFIYTHVTLSIIIITIVSRHRKTLLFYIFLNLNTQKNVPFLLSSAAVQKTKCWSQKQNATKQQQQPCDVDERNHFRVS